MPASAAAKKGSPAVTGDSIEISVRGKWIRVPAVSVDGWTVVTTGRWIKMAAVHDEEWLERAFTDPTRCLAKLQEQPKEARPDIFTFMQRVLAAEPRFDFPFERTSLAVAHIPTFKEWWESVPQETRKNVRRSQKRGVTIRVQPFDDELVRGIAGIQNESPMRQGRRYPHYGKSFEQVKRDHAGLAEHSDFICAYFEDELIGFLKLVYRGDSASILQLNSKSAHYDKRPANALLCKAVELCAAKNIAYLTYGRFNYGNKTDSSLREFKIRHGFENMLVPRFYVPLTQWGKFCVKAKLYRELMEILPGGLIAAALSARSTWYQMKARLSRRSSESERPNRNRQAERSNSPAGSNP